VAAVGRDEFISYATERDQQGSAAKAADPNGFLAVARESLARFL